MTDLKNTLMKLINELPAHEGKTLEEALADHLIAEGVTVQQWIPVTERLPEMDGTYIVRTTTGAVTTGRFYTAKTFPPTHYRPTEYHSESKWQSNRNVTHWMHLPEPPKEDDC